eukprot:scaffold126469_cov90-Phaeocystis_antarctica.AAC.8
MARMTVGLVVAARNGQQQRIVGERAARGTPTLTIVAASIARLAIVAHPVEAKLTALARAGIALGRGRVDGVPARAHIAQGGARRHSGVMSWQDQEGLRAAPNRRAQLRRNCQLLCSELPLGA